MPPAWPGYLKPLRNDGVTDPVRRFPEWVIRFPGTTPVSPSTVGGKAFSLIELSTQDLGVPPGWVLTTSFFSAWVRQIQDSDAWRTLIRAPLDEQASLCEGIKARARDLSLDPRQERTLAFLLEDMATSGLGDRFAVRSSSAQEDQPGHSFAGGYRTCLGVQTDDLPEAIGLCFASLFDHRVLAYKLARGLDPRDCSMAVIVQQQIASEAAGVAFSLNPLNNDRDQAVIEANPGLGETVVSGESRPDHWVIDKPTGQLVEFRPGDRRISRWLGPDGNPVDRVGVETGQPCIDQAQLDALLARLGQVEHLCGGPVDIEWAVADAQLHLLQARPTTAWVPLPPSLMTPAGQPRRLYMDAGLSSGLTINAPISPMGLSVIRQLLVDLAEMTFGRLAEPIPAEEAIMHFDGGRMYQDLSNLLWLVSPRRLAASMELSDTRMARLLESVDGKQYRAPKRPRWARWRMLLRLPSAFWRARKMLLNMVLPFLAPERMHGSQTRQLKAMEARLRAPVDEEMSLSGFWDCHVQPRLREMFDISLPVVGIGGLATVLFKRLAQRPADDDWSLLDRVDRGFEGNVVVEMNVAMARLARLLPEPLRTVPEDLEHCLADEAPDSPWKSAWQDFMQQFGFRGAGEMDIARPRYADAPVELLRQIVTMPTDPSVFDPQQAWQDRIRQRREAVTTLLERSGPIRRSVLSRLHRVIERYAGLRDTPKQHLLTIMQSLRGRVLAAGHELRQRGQLDELTQVFQLELPELIDALNHPESELSHRIEQRAAWHHKLETAVINFPPLIDSRGRILRQARSPGDASLWRGVGLSPGMARGRARIVHSPEAATLEPGDVLIAYATDPGWTPLFANAAAVVLEVGGALQHGAVVARELGLPCVAGIDGATTTLLDRSMIEVDADAGTIRVLAGPDQSESKSESGLP